MSKTKAADNYLVLVYAYPDEAQSVFDGLYERLCGLHPELIGDPDGLVVEDEVLYFKDCEVLVV